ncbi:MAG: hypothetical protein EOP66_10830 [Sphingomonas sp.]|nr:MAG: hypothetical protein EOP66_10830 [Sphingomonas sp.]
MRPTLSDRVAILSENRREYVELQLACAERGVIIVCQNWRPADPELCRYLSHISPILVLVSERHAPVLARTQTVMIATRSDTLPAMAPAHNAQDGASMNDAASTNCLLSNSRYIPRLSVRMVTTDGER